MPTLLTPGSIPNVDQVPIDYITDWFKSRMPEFGYMNAELKDRILVVNAKTGSGKSTTLPVGLFRILKNPDSINKDYFGKSILCTQPRILTALELARDVDVKKASYNPDMILGKTVGYQTGPFSLKPRNGLIYATLGVLTVQLYNSNDNEICDKYKFIIIDEAHERTIGSDITLWLLYKFYKRNIGNINLPFLVLTSATIDTHKYADYFEVPYKTNIIDVLGQSFPIETIWPKTNISDIFKETANIVKKICINNKDDDPLRADILVFMMGNSEIRKTAEEIEKLKLNILVIALTGDKIKLKAKDYFYVFASRSELPKINGKIPERRVIIATAVAETGLTIDTLKYVCDSGFSRNIEAFGPYGLSSLMTRPAPQSRIIQRRGRSGRLFPGVFYPLYTERTFKMLDNIQYPEIITNSQEYSARHLSLFRLSDNFKDVKLLDFPPDEVFIYTNAVATLLGFIDHESKLTELGEKASHFNYINMEQSKIIFSGFAYDVSILDLITICALMTISRNNIFLSPIAFAKYMKENKKKFDANMPQDSYSLLSIIPKFLKEEPDINFYYKCKILICDEFIESLLVFESFIEKIISFKNHKRVREWCNENCLSFDTLKEISNTRADIINDLLVRGVDIGYNSDKKILFANQDNFMQRIINIKKCLYEGLRHKMLTYDELEKRYKTLAGIKVSINSNILSTELQNVLRSNHILNGEILPKYIITSDIKLVLNSFSPEYIYKPVVNYVCVLDGFVSPDLSFGEVHYV